MNLLDILLVTIAGAFMIRCSLRGFIKETLSCASFIVGGLSGIIFYRQAGELIENFIVLNGFLEIVGFIVSFLGGFILVKAIEVALRASVEALKLGWADRILGIVLGFVEGIVVICLLVFLMIRQPLFELDDLLNSSAVASFFIPILIQKGAFNS